jgi:ubiquinone/menaquinone biosynthesis C-methylase UbiE
LEIDMTMNDRIFNQSADRLRSPERVARLEVKKVVNLCLKNREITSVLDVGVGSGVFAEEFSKRGLVVAGTDVNPDMLVATKLHVPLCDIRIGKAENLPFEDGEFDLVFMGLVFHEVTDYQRAMNHAFRVSANYAAILEWKYKTEEFGPPLEHRLQGSFIEKTAKEAGFKKCNTVEMKNLMLYTLEK